MLETARANAKRGKYVPPQIEEHLAAEPPPALPGTEIYLTAFRQLGTCRSLGMSLGPIPWRDAVAWGERYGFEGVLLHDFVQIVSALDRAFLAALAARRKDA